MVLIQGWLPTMSNFDRFFSVMIEQADSASGGAFMNWIQGWLPEQPNIKLDFSPPLLRQLSSLRER